MALPFFYLEQIEETVTITLNEETSKHVVQVLRMKVGEQMNLTNGKGAIYTVAIIEDHRKKCVVNVLSKLLVKQKSSSITIAISPLKNNSRFEWFLEKVTEIGVPQIVPLICERTEKSQLKMERLKGILISAMLQSQQAWMPVLHDAIKITELLTKLSDKEGVQKLIAHCEEDKKTLLIDIPVSPNCTILIGPEGDFTSKEIAFALQSGFEPVSLGDTRLRTETAGIVAAVLLCNKPSGQHLPG
jgi:16S rRNA (uracil1498-N3)-methyltransferase